MNVYYPQRYFCFLCQDFLKGNYYNSKLWSFNSHLLSFKSQWTQSNNLLNDGEAKWLNYSKAKWCKTMFAACRAGAVWLNDCMEEGDFYAFQSNIHSYNHTFKILRNM